MSQKKLGIEGWVASFGSSPITRALDARDIEMAEYGAKVAADPEGHDSQAKIKEIAENIGVPSEHLADVIKAIGRVNRRAIKLAAPKALGTETVIELTAMSAFEAGLAIGMRVRDDA